jgi:hypothetical protein
MPTNPPSLLFQGDKDLVYIKKRDWERYYLNQQRHEIRFHQPQAAEINNYGEPSAGHDVVYSAPVSMPIHIHLDPDEKLLTRFGFDHPQSALVVFSIAVLEGLQINRRDPLKGPKIGDRIDFFVRDSFKQQFEIRDVKEWDFFGNTKAPLHCVCVAQKMVENQVV